MNNRKRTFLSAGLAVAVLTIADATIMTAGPLQASGAKRLAAQSTQDREEEEAFLEARRAINREEFERAVELFKALRDDTSQSRYRADSYYWEAFARYRLGELQESLALLETMIAGYRGSWQSRTGVLGHLNADAHDLRLRILGHLAEQGDARAAEEVLRQSEAVLMQADTTMRADIALEEQLAAMSSALEAWPAELQTRPETMFADTVATPLAFAVDRIGRGLTLTFRPVTFRGWVPEPDHLREGCEGESVQQAALTALMRLETDRMKVLRSVVARSGECAANLREHAVELISRQGTEEAEKELVTVARNHPDLGTRRSAVLGLRRFETPSAVDALSTILMQGDDPDIQEAAIQALRRSSQDGASEILETFALDSSRPEDLREDAIGGLGRREDVETEVLMRLFRAVDSKDLKGSVLTSLRRRAQAGDDRVTKWLFERVFDMNEDRDVRAQALEAWSRGSSVDLSDIGELYGQLQDSIMKERFFYALYRKTQSNPDRAPAIAEKMVEVARTETDPEVRERAVYWLGRTGSEEAIEFLLELLSNPPPDTLSSPRKSPLR